MKTTLAAAFVSVLLVAALGAGLEACSPTQATTAGAATAGVGGAIDPSLVSALQQTCQTAQPIVAVATAPAAPAKVSALAQYAQAYCNGLATGSVPATTDSNTPSWLAGVLNAVQIAAQVAGYVMPVLALF